MRLAWCFGGFATKPQIVDLSCRAKKYVNSTLEELPPGWARPSSELELHEQRLHVAWLQSSTVTGNPDFWRSLIFSFGSWRRVRVFVDPRCGSYRFKLVLYALCFVCFWGGDRDSFGIGWSKTGADDRNMKVVWYQTRTSQMRSGPRGGPRRSRLGRRGSITDWHPAFDKRTISKLGKTFEYTGVNLACNVPRQKVNFPACKLPTTSPCLPLRHLRRTIGSAVAWWLPLFKWKCRSPLFCQVPPKQCTNYSLQGMEE